MPNESIDQPNAQPNDHAIEPADKDEDGGASKEKPRPEEPPQSSSAVTTNPADPMFFAGLHETIKLMAQEERRRKLMSLAIV